MTEWRDVVLCVRKWWIVVMYVLYACLPISHLWIYSLKDNKFLGSRCSQRYFIHQEGQNEWHGRKCVHCPMTVLRISILSGDTLHFSWKNGPWGIFRSPFFPKTCTIQSTDYGGSGSLDVYSLFGCSIWLHALTLRSLRDLLLLHVEQYRHQQCM